MKIERQLVQQVFGIPVGRQVLAVAKEPGQAVAAQVIRQQHRAARRASKTHILMSLRILRLNAHRAEEYVRAISSK